MRPLRTKYRVTRIFECTPTAISSGADFNYNGSIFDNIPTHATNVRLKSLVAHYDIREDATGLSVNSDLISVEYLIPNEARNPLLASKTSAYVAQHYLPLTKHQVFYDIEFPNRSIIWVHMFNGTNAVVSGRIAVTMEVEFEA